MFRRAFPRRGAGMRAETPGTSTLPLLEAAAVSAGVPAALQLVAELEAGGYFEAGLVEQWEMVRDALDLRLASDPEPARALERILEHPEPRLRFHAPALVAARWPGDADRALAALRRLAADPDDRVIEAAAAFGVRPFAHRLGPEVVERLLPWVRDPNPRVRRTAVQALRPRGFWVKHLDWAVATPSLLLPLLEELREEHRRFPANAVANCWNDVTRSHPALALAVLERWLQADGPQAEHVARKGLRSLLKAGDPRALRLFGLDPLDLEVHARLDQDPVVAPNSALRFEIDVHNRGDSGTAHLVYEIQTPGKNAARPRRKRFHGGRTLLPGASWVTLVVRERIFDRKAVPLLDGPGCAVFLFNGAEAARVPFEIRRAQPSQG